MSKDGEKPVDENVEADADEAEDGSATYAHETSRETVSTETLVRALSDHETEPTTDDDIDLEASARLLAGRLKRPAWLDDLEQELGRPLRVLHMGNVANNAYLNAKIMRAAGIDADALAYDYYHVMGTPEWEDANYDGNIGDPFFPDWWRAKLNGFERPGWFIQGPKAMCVDYLLAKFGGDQYRAKVLHARLELETHYFAYRCSPKFRKPETGAPLGPWLMRHLQFGMFVFGYLSRHRNLVGEFFGRRFKKVTQFLTPFWRVLKFIIAIVGSVIAAPFVLIRAVVTSDYLYLRQAIVLWRWRMGQMIAPVIEPLRNVGSSIFRTIFRRKFSEVFGRTVPEMLHSRPAILDQKPRVVPEMDAEEAAEDPEKRLTPEERHLAQVERWKALAAVVADIQMIKGEGGAWAEDHKSWHSKTSEFRLRQDFQLATASVKGWREVFKNYDIVQCYAVDGIIPLAGNVRPYFAYEHGTLRQIPFDNTPIGRLTATAYRNAEAAFVTNLDNLPRCDDLGIDPAKVVALPHALDDSKLLIFQRNNSQVRPDNSRPSEFFSPARQDWQSQDMNYTKGNDIFFKAMKIVADEGREFRATLVAWGRDLDASKAFLEELGIADRITWVEPMKKAELWKRYLSCHAVVDQFVIPAFGSVTFEALTLGRPTITRIDKKLAKQFFGVEPPVMSASTPKQVATALRKIADDPEDKAGLGKKTGQWAKNYHSSQRILDLQLETYRGSIEKVVANQAAERRMREAERHGIREQMAKEARAL
jgi:glycosyltransferase involved in cell wall biosynthesis